MNKIKVYLDTSVISYLDQEDAPEKTSETREVWERLKNGDYDIFISDLVLDEISRCKEEKQKVLLNYLLEIEYTMITIEQNIVEFSKKIIDYGILNKKSANDCIHIAAAILAGCDVLISWNLKHIANIKTIRGIKVITVLEGYKDLFIYPPPSILIEEE